MCTRKDMFFLTTKLSRRSKQGAVEEIGKSLTALQTHPIDLVSFTLSARGHDRKDEIWELFFA